MLKVRCFEDFDSGYPCVLIHGTARDYERAALHLVKQTESSLDDPNCFQYYEAEVFKPISRPNFYINAQQCQELQEMFSKRDCLHLDKKDCQALAEMFRSFAADPRSYHDYYDENKAMDNLPVPVCIKISIGEYDDEMFTD